MKLQNKTNKRILFGRNQYLAQNQIIELDNQSLIDDLISVKGVEIVEEVVKESTKTSRRSKKQVETAAAEIEE